MKGALPLVLVLALMACGQKVPEFSASSVDFSVSENSLHPVAVAPALVGTYSGRAKSGGGYFYDDVLKYRVWLHPENGAEPLAGNSDYFAAFAQYEPALEFARTTAGAEQPIVLVRQVESVNEPSPGVLEWVKEERITEWQVAWLEGSRREPDSISNFLSDKHPSKQ